VTDTPELPFLPPGLVLGDDDVVEGVTEIVDDADLALEAGAEAELEGEAEALPGDLDVVELEAPVTERTSGFDGIGTRREARERALALLYEAEQKGLSPLADVLDDLPLPPEAFAGELVVGVSDHLAEIDELLGRFSVGWTVARMPAIDRTLLRLGTFELGHTDVPIGACISEAVELAKRYSTDDSHSFVNGLLSRMAAELRPAG
jgi:N utilization substance protein B